MALGGTSFAAATVITGKNVKDSSLTGADVKKGSLTGSDVKNKSLAPADFNGSVQGPKGDIGPQGPKGDNGTNGTNGTDATINGVAAGGDLAGTFPNPTIDDEAITTAKLAPGIQEATIVSVARGQDYDNNAATIGPFSGPVRLLVDCAGPSSQSTSLGMRIIAQRPGTSGPGQIHGSYVRGTNTVQRVDHALQAFGFVTNSNNVVDTAADVGGTGNDSGFGSFIIRWPDATVSGTFSYLADATHCELLATMQLMQ